MSIVIVGNENGHAVEDDKFSFVLTLRESLTSSVDKNDFIAGNAVLIAQQLAITSVHCLLDKKRYLSVRSAIYPDQWAKVEAIVWMDKKIYKFKADEQYPKILEDGTAEDIVGLVLGPFHSPGRNKVKPLERWRALGEDGKATIVAAEGGQNHPADSSSRRKRIAVVAPDRVTNGGARFFSFRTLEPSHNGISLAEAVRPHPGFPLESGAAAVSGGNGGSALELRGLQVSAPGVSPPLVPLKPGSFEGSVIGILPLDTLRIARMREWAAGKLPSSPSPVQEMPKDPRRFKIQHYRDQHIITGPEDLLELTDLDFFHCKVWRLYAVRMGLGVLKTDANLWTRRVARDQVELVIAAADSWGSTSVTLHASGNFSVGGFFWLYGRTQFRGKVIHVYLFRLSDLSRETGKSNLRRVRIAVFDTDGPHLGDRPEYHSMLFGRPYPVKFVRAVFRSDDDRVQDDIGNGHEGQDPP